MNRKLMFSSNNNMWCTPQDFFDKLNKEFKFTLDPCATKKSAKCKKFFTIKEDGLEQDWSGERCFVNPPYGKETKKWVAKCYKEALKKNTLVVLLIPARTDTSYFHDFILGFAEIRFVRGRLSFVNLDSKSSKKSPAPFPSMVCIFGRKNHE